MTRRMLFTTLSVGLLIACAYFLVDTMAQKQQQTTLRTQITDVIKTIDQIPRAPHDLEQRMADIQANLDIEQDRLSDKINTTDVIDSLHKFAATNQVSLTWLSTTPWALINIEEYEYLILGISLDLEGSLNNLVNYIRELESSSPGLVHVQYLDVTNIEEQISSSSPVSASLDVAIYAHPPITD